MLLTTEFFEIKLDLKLLEFVLRFEHIELGLLWTMVLLIMLSPILSGENERKSSRIWT